MAETQSFVLQTRACQDSRSEDHIREATQTSGLESVDDEISKQSCREESFQLGLSDSSHIQDVVQALDMESTQAFVSVEATQLYAATSHATPTLSMNDSELDATQAYSNQEEEPVICSAVPKREGWENLALEATQAYVSDSYHDSEVETANDEKIAIATDETQPFYVPTSATLAMAETQPMCVFEEEDIKHPVTTAVLFKVRSKNETKERAEHSEADISQGRPLKVDLSLAETQPMCTSDDRESDDEDSFPSLRNRKTKQLKIEDEQTQPLASSGQSLVETQLLQSVDDNLAPRGSEAFPEDNSVAAQSIEALQFEKEKKAALISSDPSTAETQLMTTGEDEESDKADSVLALPRRKLRPLQEDETQLTVCEPSVFETQPMVSGENGDDVDSLPGTEMTKAKPSQILEEKTQLVTDSRSTTRETWLLEAEAEAGTSGSKVNGKRGTRARSRKVSTLCDEETSKRQTREIKEAFSAAAQRGKLKSGEEKEEKREDKQEEHTSEDGGVKSRNDVDVLDKTEQNISQIKKQEEQSLGEKNDDTDLRQLVRENLEEERKEPDEGEENKIIEAENAQRLGLERERAEREKTERKGKEQEERTERIQKDAKQFEEREDKERLECKKLLREDKVRLEKEKTAKMDNEGTEREEKDMLESERRKHDESLGREDQQHCVRQENEAKELDRIEGYEKEKVTEENVLKEQDQKEETKAKLSARGRRAAKRTAAAVCKTEPVKDTCISTNDDVPARRTRSRSNSSNSVSSERSASSVSMQESRGRGRGRGARRTSEPPHVVASRSSSRRKTMAAYPTQADSNDDTGITGVRLRSNSSNLSFNQSPQGQGRGSRQRGRGRKAETHSVSHAVTQSGPKTTTRGRKNTKAESSHDTEKAGSQQATTSRGQWRSSSNGCDPTDTEDGSNQGEHVASEESPQSKKNVRGRSHKAVKNEAMVAPPSAALGTQGETKELRKGRKRESEASTDNDSGSGSKFLKREEKEQIPREAEEAAEQQAQDEIPVQTKRRGRASITQTKKPLNPSGTGPGPKENIERIVEEPIEKRGRGRLAAVQKKKKEEQEDAKVSVDQHARGLEPEVT